MYLDTNMKPLTSIRSIVRCGNNSLTCLLYDYPRLTPAVDSLRRRLLSCCDWLCRL